MSEYPLLNRWWRETAEFKRISEELRQHDIFFLYGPPGIGKKTLIQQLGSLASEENSRKICYVDYGKIHGTTWPEKFASLKKISQEKDSQIVVKATTFDFFEIHGIRRTSERKDLSKYTKELQDWFEDLSHNLTSRDQTDFYYHSLHISHSDAEHLLDAIVSSETLKTTVDKETKNLLLRYARICTDDVPILRIQEGKGYYFPSLLKNGLLEIRDPVTASIDTEKLDTFRKTVEQTKTAEQVLLPQPHLFPTVDLALVPFIWDAIQAPKAKLAGQVGQNFIQFLSSDANPLKKVLETVLVGVPVAGIGFAFLFYFAKKDEKDISKTLIQLPRNWKILPLEKRKAIGECYDGLFGLEKGTTEKSFDAIANLKAEELERRIHSVEDEIRALRREVEEMKNLFVLLSRYTPPPALATGRKWYETEALNFREELERYNTGFVGREWLFDELKTWVAREDSRVLLLTGDAGIGKSAIAANLTVLPEIRSIHFCSRSNAKSCRPVAWVQALICQLALQFPSYREILDQIPEPDWNDPAVSLFRELVSDRLAACKAKLNIECPLVFVIDALDEADSEMVTFLLETIDRIPSWIRLVLTSRPDNEIITLFPDAGVTHRQISADDNWNRADVSSYLRNQYQELVGRSILTESPGLQNRLEESSDGNFLYATLLMAAMGDEDPARRLTPDEIGTLHKDLKKLYDLMFRRRFSQEDIYKREVRPLLDCLVAARAPVHESLLIAATGINRPGAYEGLRALSQFLIHDDEGYRLFHKSVAEWLAVDPGCNRFAAFPAEGHRHLANTGLNEVNNLKQEISSYTLRWLPLHILETGQTDDLSHLLSNPRYFILLWNLSPEWARIIWVAVESVTPLRMTDIYAMIINEPSRVPFDFVEIISYLLYYSDHPSEALSLFRFMEDHARAADDTSTIAKSLGNQAIIHMERGDLNRAMELLKEQEHLYRELDNKDGQQRSLGNQALIYMDRGNRDRAVELLKEKQRLCRELGNEDVIQKTLGSKAIIHMERGDLDQELGSYASISRTLLLQEIILERENVDPRSIIYLMKVTCQNTHARGEKRLCDAINAKLDALRSTTDRT